MAGTTVMAAVATVSAGLEHAQYLTTPPVPAVSAASGVVAPKPGPATTLSDTGKRKADFGPSIAQLDILGINHSRIDSWVKRLSTTLKSSFEESLVRMNKYASMMSTKLDQRGMPQDLKYLAMIESEFNPAARSPVGAVGLWQFMGSTARRFGLKVGGGVDQRKDPAASTDAALTYLSKLHDKFGSWYLAAAAYNAGEGTVQHALQKMTGRTTGTDADFFKILPALPKETRDYVPKLIAAARIGNNPSQYGISTPNGE
jgi:membrane-bound lytic murein transglycosylase D